MEAGGADLKQEKPLVLDPEEIAFDAHLLDSPVEAVPEHTMALHDAVDPEVEKAKEEAAAQKKKARSSKRKAKSPRNRTQGGERDSAPARKRKKRAKPPQFEGFRSDYPPPGQMMEFEAGGEWFDGEFLKMELDSDGDGLCHIRDPQN